MDSTTLDFYALSEQPQKQEEYSKVMFKIKKLEDTIKKELESQQQRNDTYRFKRASTSLDFNTTALQKSEDNYNKKKLLLTQKYEQDCLNLQEEYENDVLKFKEKIEAAKLTIDDEKKVKKNKIVIGAEYDIAELKKQIEKMNLPKIVPVPSSPLPKTHTRKKICPCGKSCKDIDKCFMTFKSPAELAMEKRVKKELEKEAEEDKEEEAQAQPPPLTPFQGLPPPDPTPKNIYKKGVAVSAKPLGIIKYAAPIETV
jgi:hypothetical protein